jgi:penicillin-binding protein 1A
VAGAILVPAVIAWALAIAGAWFTWDVTMRLPGRDAIAGIGDMAQATTIFDRRGEPVFTIFKEQRIETPVEKLAPILKQAVVAIEDQRFYEHRGVDLVRVAGAMLANLQSGRRGQGGSTITQQLARQSFLTRDKTYRRKLKEVLLAAQIEHSFTKDEILGLYLNKVYFGDGFHGIEAAALGYFGKSASDVSLDEAAMLAGLIQSPSNYMPTEHPQRALARRTTVLAAMRESGVIDQAAYAQAKDAALVLRNGLQRDEDFGLYYKEQVRRELVDRFGWERVSQGGLRVFAAIDADVQRAVERSIEDELVRIESRRGFPHATRAALGPPAKDAAPDYLQASAVVIDPASGQVLALAGGRDFKESRYNRAFQAKRQPGSAFKPLVYAEAMEEGRSPATVLTGLDDAILTPDGMWMPEDEHSSASSMTLRTALRTSSNRAAVKLIRDVGIERTIALVKRMRLGDLPPVPSIALGAGEVTLAALTSAYAAFANGGVVRSPVLVMRVEDADGQVLFQDEGTPERAVSETTAFLMASMLSDVINSGTGSRARANGFLLPAGGKTGTTNDYHDVWFVGFTPHVATGVWIGFDQPRSIMPNGYAGDVAVPLWAAIMKRATAGAKPDWVARPDGLVGVEVCRLSGKRPNDGCSHVEVVDDEGAVTVRSMVYTEYFARGTQPGEICPLHDDASFFEKLAGGFGNEGPAPVVAREAGLPTVLLPPTAVVEAPPVEAPAAAEPAAEVAAEAPKKRGFWSKIFGRGKDEDKKKPVQKPPE